jgi:hypothetical protein
MPLNVYLMNFGERPAKIHSATVEFGEAKQDADIRTGSCVRRHEIAFVEIRMEGDFKKAIHEYMERSDEQLNWLKRELTLTIIYSETWEWYPNRCLYDAVHSNTRNIEQGFVTLAVLRKNEDLDAGDKRWPKRQKGLQPRGAV